MASNRFFQWIIGDQRGMVVVYDGTEEDDGVTYVKFKNGSRMNENLIADLNQPDLSGKMMAEVDSIQNIWKFNERIVGRVEERWEVDAEGVNQLVEPFTPGRKVVDLIAPRKSSKAYIQSLSNIAPPDDPSLQHPGDISPTPPINPQAVLVYTNANDPVYIMMSKAKKTVMDIDMILNIALPPKNLYDVAKESFEDGDVKTLEYIIESLDITEIKKALKEGIRSMYEKTEGITLSDKHQD